MNDIEKAIEVLKMENELMQFNPSGLFFFVKICLNFVQ